ncbi:methyltransferase domain-containing protein [Ponticaulis sp.]|uniref:methyltransferase domain-containing protein n=1 Tax=Ponticaulis sp. TaxID=2020902 RepID=UPI000B749E3B|nr:methyltransferase domain-containing protein [Ponticaulis sp.]MAI90431.1 methyltransferase type 11 [Ponticaulis sp.]OUY00132.1 MAG: methyltransferase type 11 [Hyphomonadaceae bacterium TMED5]|tara:strand:+ start:48200 stop:49258 length:1059 start_codon:yes stop_codon:yes gene_type:complete
MKHEIVQNYYGSELAGSCDLKTDACSTLEAPRADVSAAIAEVHDNVASRYYGCGLAIPPVLKGLKVLDLGSGAGRDVFAIAKLVGETGHVTGVDMTLEQLDVARAHEDWHAEKFGYSAPNTRFVEGYLEELETLDLEPESFDLIISNCVINLCTDKPAVFQAAYNLLKPGGELYFADVYADRRMPDELVKDPVLYGECLSGALYWNDYIAMAKEVGFTDPRIVEHRRLGILDRELQEKLSPIRFASVTGRLMKLPALDAGCEDYGQAVIYKGGVEGMERAFKLDCDHVFEKGKVEPVCGNTLSMLIDSRFAEHFRVIGDGQMHYGRFPGCGAPDVFAEADAKLVSNSTSSCC